MKKLKSSFEYLNTDGTLLHIRWIRPEDKERIADGADMMSDEGLYLRFFMPIKKLSDQQLEFLSKADQTDHIAWGVLDKNCLQIPGLGIARFVRETDEPQVAEAAVTVPDKYQRSGIGTLLLAVLNHSARANGIKTLRSNVLSENKVLISTLKKLGGVASPQEDSIIKIDLPVFDDMKTLHDADINPRYKKYLLDLNDLMFE